jgi:RNA polymerase subunit RPABC4/transcription elongation factor Spt4
MKKIAVNTIDINKNINKTDDNIYSEDHSCPNCGSERFDVGWDSICSAEVQEGRLYIYESDRSEDNRRITCEECERTVSGDHFLSLEWD